MTVARMDHDEAATLLPWYVNGTLTGTELERLEDHVGSCDECHADLVIARGMLKVINDQAAVPMVPRPNREKLFRSLDTLHGGSDREKWLPRAAVAATLALVTAALLYLGIPGTSTAPSDYFTATSSTSRPVVHYVIQIEFEAVTTPAYRAALLDDLGALESTEMPGGDTVRAVLPLGAISVEDLDAAATLIRSRAGVRSVEVVAIQLPMERGQ